MSNVSRKYGRMGICALMLTLALAGCGGGAASSAGSADSDLAAQSETVSSDGEVAQAQPANQAAAQGQMAMGGSPWINCNEAGNLPVEQPELKDDIYLHTNYDYIASHQQKPGGTLADSKDDMREAVTAIIKDESKKSHGLDQLRIFYNQAANVDARKGTGLAEIQPYLDKIDAVTTVDELNALLASSEYPFVPFVNATVGSSDMRDVNIVCIYPNFVFSNGFLGGAASYQDTDDPNLQVFHALLMASDNLTVQCNLQALGLEGEEAQAHQTAALALETAYGKYADYEAKWMETEYGSYGKAIKTYSLDELAALAPQLPIREMLAKMQKDASPRYAAISIEWLSQLGSLWTQENLDGLKDLVKLSMMKECKQILDPSIYEVSYTLQGQTPPNADAQAFAACDDLNTFGNEIGRIFVDEVLGAKAKDRLVSLTKDILGTYSELIQNTSWLSDGSKANALEKLDRMTLNILEPDGGYPSFDGLELTPAESGGTLMGNFLALKQYRYEQEKSLIGAPAKALGSWEYLPPSIANCFYDPSNNSINIMPGFIVPGTYRDDMSYQEMCAAIGAVIGHEISHGFDYAGSQYDAYGVGNSIYTSEDTSTFVGISQKLADYYSGIQISDGVYARGDVQKVEATADLCGLHAALETAKKQGNIDYKKFFTDHAVLWKQVQPMGTTLALAYDTHPLNYLRVNVNVQMLEEFYEAFGITEGDGMYLAPESRILLWGEKAK